MAAEATWKPHEKHGHLTEQSDLPGGTSLPDLLGIAAVSALLANLLNNLPAILIFAPVAVASGRAARLARRALRMSSPGT